ncbi:MAG: hypothetical protein CMC15_17090 [Flavobacteriaceae bacterium]|nr:hypothetical protein [Flavobacteriaceae bacterium]
MSNGQDPQGVCCYCNPFPNCGYWCEVTDASDCFDSGGTWLGEVQGNSCEACEGLCANCESGECTSDDDCPVGYKCVSGECVPDITDTNLNICNRPGLNGSQNCPEVIHVKRPRFPDGTPDYPNWGVAIWHPPCDEDCDGDIYDEAPLDENGEFVRRKEDMGVITFDLLNDIYDEETGEPIGQYGNSCCCPLFLHVVQCGYGAVVIHLKNVCPGQIPQWNPKQGEVLILRGKEGTPAEGWCGYSQYNFNEDGSQRYSENCGNQPLYEWVLSTYPNYGNCPEGYAPPDALSSNQSLLQFCDLDVEVFQVPDPSWVYEDSPAHITRICTYACEGCYGVFEQCGGCQCHPEYPQCKCITKQPCGGDQDTMFVSFGGSGEVCNRPTVPWRNGDCMKRIKELSGEEYAQSNTYWDLPGCLYGDREGDECKECDVILYTLCNSRDCGNTGFVYPRHIFTTVQRQWLSVTHVQARFGQNEGFPGSGLGAACYAVKGIKKQKELPLDAVYHAWIGHRVFWEGEYHYTDSCDMWSPCEPGDPNATRFDCMTYCPTHNCTTEPGQSGSACHYCCQCNGVACEATGACNYNLNDFNSPNLFPSSIETELELDVKNIKSSLGVTFNNPKNLPIKANPSEEDYELHFSMMQMMYKCNFDKQPLNGVIPVGSFADNRNKVPQVNEANLIGYYEEDGVTWSAWVTVGTCNAVNNLNTKYRVFSFEYTVFAYCQSNVCEIDSKVLETKLVEFTLEGTYEN